MEANALQIINFLQGPNDQAIASFINLVPKVIMTLGMIEISF
jgi:hypothetical protein